MRHKNQPKTWIDPHLVRPAGWSPAQTGSVPAWAASADTFAKEMHIMGVLSSMNGMAQLASYCHLFYTDAVFAPTVLSSSWSPWRYPGVNLAAIQGILPYVEDVDTRELAQRWADRVQALEDLNTEWKEALAKFFNVPIPETEEGYRELRNKVEAHRQEKGPTWLSHPEFESLVLRLQQVIAEMQQLQPKLQDVLQSFYSRVRPEDLQKLLGDQRAQDLIDASRGEPDHKRAIRQLNRALRYAAAGGQAGEVYLELGSRYAALGEIEQAIENYSKSLKVSKPPNPMVHYWRGELFYEQEQWARALQDFERAVSLGLVAPARQQAEQYISELHSR